MNATRWLVFESTNSIISGLPFEEFDLLRPQLTRVGLVQNQVLSEQGQAAEHVYFVEGGMVSLLADADTARLGVQVAMIGREGLVGGLPLFGMQDVTTEYAVVHGPGSALRIRTESLLGIWGQTPALQKKCASYVQALIRQVMQTSAYNANGSLMDRCIRWLLMAHERAGEDDLQITHESLSTMLGVRRAGVTVATTALQNAGLIRAGRGRIKVINRSGLEEAYQKGFRA